MFKKILVCNASSKQFVTHIVRKTRMPPYFQTIISRDELYELISFLYYLIDHGRYEIRFVELSIRDHASNRFRRFNAIPRAAVRHNSRSVIRRPGHRIGRFIPTGWKTRKQEIL